MTYYQSLICLVVGTLVLSPAEAQQGAKAPTIAERLLEVSAVEREGLPTPSQYNPTYWSFPEYARTEFKCLGDDSFANYLASAFDRKRGQFAFHVITQGFVSVTLAVEDENAVDTVDLSERARDTLRTFFKFEARRLQESENARTTAMYAATVPGLLTGNIVWFLYAGGIVLDKTVGVSFADAQSRLILLADQLRSSTQLYRSVTAIDGPGGRKYVRYLFAVRPNDREITVLRDCIYARRIPSPP